ncbi:hypothetical protein SAY86_006879 [Trapa natans]|uniref:RRM domain-containing protein n=1 Tax=Trapa natans TaxID=22666 RepID=A0AAN7L585_TRANT|nr:hypothetical protein SAY86_006879 [Trapa natans]
MSSAAAPVFKPLSIPGSCRHSLLPLETLHSYLSIPQKPVKIRPSCAAHTLQLIHPIVRRKTRRHSSLIALVSDSSSDWAPLGGDVSGTATLEQEEQGGEQQLEAPGAEATVPGWESEGEGGSIQDSICQGEEEPPLVEPPEEAKLFVGNLPFDVDSEKLAMLFDQAGVVEIAEVIYNRDTDRSRGFGFVTMSTVEQAEKAVETFHQYDLDGRLLTVNRAAPRGSRPERTSGAFASSFRIYVGNLPWGVDNARLEQVFSEHGKVIDARVVFDRETGRSRGFGFVTMASETEMNDAITALDGQNLDGRAIRVNVAEERSRRGF